MIITVLTDNQNSWYVPFGKILSEKLSAMGNNTVFVHDKKEIQYGDICFLLCCSRIIKKEYLDRNTNNIVVHASNLPKGKGFAPLQWQILSGAAEITLSIFEAVEAVDAGPVYFKDKLSFNGTELYNELRSALANKISEMCIQYVEKRDTLVAIAQIGDESYYPKRTFKDDEINPNESIVTLFNHFRIADNDKYPLYFYYRDRKYYLKISRDTH